MKKRTAPKLTGAHMLVLGLLLISAMVRGWSLSSSGLQNDEQMWHVRSLRFVKSLLGPFAPGNSVDLRCYWPRPFVDLQKSDSFVIGRSYPFTIKMEAPHPGTPMGFLIGLCCLFLANGVSSWSLNVGPIAEVARYPAVILGALWGLIIYKGGRELVGQRAALFSFLFMSVEPLLIGYSRLARIDLSIAVWTTAGLFCYLAAQRTFRKRWALAAGFFMGLALATNPYGLFLIPTFIGAKFLFGQSHSSMDNTRRLYSRWFNQLDCALLLACGSTFLLAYPNLWPNPVSGIVELRRIMTGLPHAKGEVSHSMPVSHWFYLVRSPLHILPWTLGLALVGTLGGFMLRRRETGLIVIWFTCTLALLSIPEGRKNSKNFLLVIPAIMLLAGMGADWMLTRLEGKVEQSAQRFLAPTLAAALFLGGILTTTAWWPYPQTYTWPWYPDPQKQVLRELVGEGEGVKEAIEYIRQQNPRGARVGCFTGENNAQYYYDASLLGSPANPESLKNYDWLLVLPKLTFGSSGSHLLVKWVRTHEPEKIIYNNQIELVRLYRLKQL